MDKETAAAIQQLLIKVNDKKSYFFAFHPGSDGEVELSLEKRKLPRDDIRAWKKKGLQAAQLVTGKVRGAKIGVEFATSQKSVPGGVANMQRLLRKLGTDAGIAALKQATAVIDLELDMAEEPEVAPVGAVDKARWDRLAVLADGLVVARASLGELVAADELRISEIGVSTLKDRLLKVRDALTEHASSAQAEVLAEGKETLTLAAGNMKALGGAAAQASKTATSLGELLASITVPAVSALQAAGLEASESQLTVISNALKDVEVARQGNGDAITRAEKRAADLRRGLELVEELLADLVKAGTIPPEKRARLTAAAGLSKASADYSDSLYNGMVGLTALSKLLADEDDERCKEIALYLDKLADGAPHDLCAALDGVVEEARGVAEGLKGALDKANEQVEVGLEFIETHHEVLELVEGNVYGVGVDLINAMLGPLMSARTDLGRLGSAL